ncbi:MAG: OsmC family protein [Syntrophothermus sp.]
MKAAVEWKGGLSFTGVGPSDIPVLIDSSPSPDGKSNGLRPTELVLLGLASCMAMDVISILEKKRQDVRSYQVHVDAPRAADFPQVFTSGLITLLVSGSRVEEVALKRAIELSVTKYCAVYAMMEKAFPITVRYEIYEQDGDDTQLRCQGTWHTVAEE